MFHKRRLDLKLILWTSLFTILITVLYLSYKIPLERQRFIKQMNAQARILTYAISKASVGPILYDDHPALQQLVESLIEKEAAVAFIRITLADDNKTTVVKESSTNSQEQVRIYKRDIKISSDKNYRLGEIKLGMYTSSYEATIEDHIWSLVVIMLIMLIVKIITQVLLVAKMVTRPLSQLVQKAQVLGEGDLASPIRLVNKDELGTLACALDNMRVKLSASHVSKDYVENIIKSLMDMLIVFDVHGKIRSVNFSTSKMLGYAEDELIGAQLSMITDCTDLLHGLDEKGFVSETEKVFMTKSGKQIPVALSGSAIKGDAAKRKRPEMVCIARNLTELKETQFQLVQSAKLAALGEMSSGLAHEINNPLCIIKGFNDLIGMKLKGHESAFCSDLREYTKSIHDNCVRIIKIVNHFREFSRQSHSSMQSTSINEVVSKSLILVREQLRLSSVVVKQQLVDDDIQVMGDSIQLEQVFINLISNAKDAISSCASDFVGEMIISTHKQGETVVIEFTDNGAGITEEEQHRIFDPFYTTKEVGRGTGLGLSVSHSIIKAHKGHLRCQSEEGKGATFRVELPLLQL
ncbi:MAG: PAS domain S-box protein [Bacteriovoracaceae bacterium]|nr:PAS domain S-box protein [Bacteriovoracaceae bacterium]